jgi:hypothetical protein
MPLSAGRDSAICLKRVCPLPSLPPAKRPSNPTQVVRLEVSLEGHSELIRKFKILLADAKEEVTRHGASVSIHELPIKPITPLVVHGPDSHATRAQYLLVPKVLDDEWQEGCMSTQVAGKVLSAGSPASLRFLQLVGEDGKVALSELFPDSRASISPEFKTVALNPCCGMSEFATDVGIHSTSHLSEILSGARKGSCKGWRGHYLSVNSRHL